MKCFAILEEMQELTAQISAWREDFHAHPELAFQEKRTSGIIAEFCVLLAWRSRLALQEPV